MTREDAIEIMESYRDIYRSMFTEREESQKKARQNGDAFDLAIAALRQQEASGELLEACKETRDAAAALMRAIAASGHIGDVLNELEPGYDGFGVRADHAIAKAEGKLL